MKLAKAAAQQLKAVVVEYDVLCATLLGQPAAPRRAPRRPPPAQPQSVQPAPPGESWARERLQSALRGLPSDIVRRVTGQQDEPPRSEDELHLERQLQAAAREQETRRRQREQRPQAADSATKGGSLRDKYLHKLNKLKEKTKQESSAGPTGLEEVTAKTSAGLSTWVVNDGANEVLSYSDLRGLFKAVIPPRDPLQDDEYKFFLKEMKDQFDMFVPKEEQDKFPDPKPILHICDEFELKPSDILVLARHAPTIRAAKDAGTHVCHYMPGDKAFPNHTAHYHITHLNEFQHLVEDFNGVSYRDKIKMGSIEF